MAFPTGPGSERIKYSALDDLTDTDQTLITGVALHIYTVISIICCEQGNNSDTKLRMRITDSDGSANPCFLIYDQAVPAYGTFVFSDRFSFDGDKKLVIDTAGGANVDVFCTYIDQDWT